MQLAPRQKEVLEHQSHGLTRQETANAMNCSLANVGNLLRECFYKLHAANTKEAIAIAMQRGLIHLTIVTAILMGCGLGDEEMMRVRYRLRQSGQIVRITRCHRSNEIA